jgi:hypothetical protein
MKFRGYIHEKQAYNTLAYCQNNCGKVWDMESLGQIFVIQETTLISGICTNGSDEDPV